MDQAKRKRLEEKGWQVGPAEDFLRASDCKHAPGQCTRLGDCHPLASTFGAFNDDPVWEDFEKAIAQNRKNEASRWYQFRKWIAEKILRVQAW